MNEIEKAIAVYEDNITQMELNPDAYGDDLPRFKLVLTALREQAKLTKAKAEGRLIELPCNVGDTVYALVNAEIVQCKVVEININERGIWFIRLFSIDDRIADYRYEHFQKTVFLTREEAEKALEGSK